jgi:CHAD domain-containing protein
MAKQTTPKLPVAAGAAAAGVVAAAAAGKAAHELAKRAEKRRRAFRLDGEEPLAEGVRRIARGQIDGAIEGLKSARDDDIGAAVHDVRKRFKRIRALARLSRDAIGTEVYRQENAAFREAGRRFAGVRDAKVLVETLDALTRRYADELPKGAFRGLRDTLAAEAEATHDRARDVRDAIAGLESARVRVTAWPLPEDAGYEALASGFERIYRRGRKALRAARKHPGDEALHDLRKRVKDLWHAAQIAGPVDEKRMRKLAKRAHKLSSTLGDHHDLSVLRDAAAERRELLAPGELRLLRGLVDRRQKRLARRAFKRAKKVYSVKPRKLVRSFERSSA